MPNLPEHSRFPLQVGQTMRRKHLHSLVGGSEQWGMTACFNGAEFLIFHNPKVGKKYGYDKWEGEQADGTFSYTGQGRRGHQTISRNNKALLSANELGKPIHLLHSDNVDCTYLGPIFLGQPAYEWKPALDQDRKMRNVLVFNLVPTGSFSYYTLSLKTTHVQAEVLDWTPLNSQSIGIDGKASGSTTMNREEFELQNKYGEWLAARGELTKIIRFHVDNKMGYLQPDFYLPMRGKLVEAKPSAARIYVRLAVGQVSDYVNLSKLSGLTAAPSILLPSEPSPDLLTLLLGLKISLTVPDSTEGFRDIPG